MPVRHRPGPAGRCNGGVAVSGQLATCAGLRRGGCSTTAQFENIQVWREAAEVVLAAARQPRHPLHTAGRRLPVPASLARESIAILFELSLADLAWKSFRGTSWALRCDPRAETCTRLRLSLAPTFRVWKRGHNLSARSRPGATRGLERASTGDCSGVLIGDRVDLRREHGSTDARVPLLPPRLRARYRRGELAAASLGWRTRDAGCAGG